MKLQQVAQLTLSQARSQALEQILTQQAPFRAELTSMAGSMPAMILASLPKGRKPVIVVGDSPDDAGYLYHDLSRTLGEEAVMMFPSGYKRHIKYGQPDPPSQIMRTEALNRWEAPELRYLVTYPEALAEKATSRKALSDHTLHVAAGQSIDLTETVKWLRENGFRQEDYVYDPGHFAVRGSILDIFAYSYEQPLRIDLFGDEIESIRAFNIETQLSESRLESADITAHIDSEKMKSMGSLFDFTGTDITLWMRDPAFTVERIRAIAAEQFSPTAMLADEGDATAMERVVDPDAIEQALALTSVVHFTAAAAPAGEAPVIDFNTSPQGIYHKNFDLISESFRRYQTDGYRMLVLSDSEKQIERLRAIFDDRGDSDLQFTPVIGTLHAGFVDHQTKTCVLTDHQIFDRFHKYLLRSDRTRTGKLALSLKELGQIEVGDYVVHVDNGVARFGGLVRTEVNGRMQEMVKLQYADDDLLLVSIHSLHKLSKYRGKEGAEPRICRLGSRSARKASSRTWPATSYTSTPPDATKKASPTRPTPICSMSWRHRSSTKTPLTSSRRHRP